MSEQPVNPASHETKESTSVDFEALNSGERMLLRLYTLINPTAAEQWLKDAIKASANGEHSIDEFIYGAEQTLAAELAVTPVSDTVESETGAEVQADEHEGVTSLHAAAMAIRPRMQEIKDRVEEMRQAHALKGGKIRFSFPRAVNEVAEKLNLIDTQSENIDWFAAFKEVRNIVADERTQEQQLIDDTAAAIAGDKTAFRKIRQTVNTGRENYRRSHPEEGTLLHWPQGDAVLEALRALAEDSSAAGIDTELLEKLDSRTALKLWKDTKDLYKAQLEAVKAPKSVETVAATKGRSSTPKQSTYRFSPEDHLGDDDDYEIQQDEYRQSVEDPKAAALKENAAAMDRIGSGIAFARRFIKIAQSGDEAAKRALMSSLPRNGADLYELGSSAPFDEVTEFYQQRLAALQAEMKQKLEERENINNGTGTVSGSDDIETHEEPIARTKNRELADQVPDLLDGQLAVNVADGVYYGAGATALGKKVGGRFAPSSQLRDIVAHADQIRDGLANRDEPGTLPEYGPLVLSFIDQTHDALTAARDAAETRRRNELQHGGRFKQFLKNAWMGENGLAGSYYLDKYKKEALAQIQQNGDVLTYESTDIGARTQAQLATIERFQSEYDEAIHTDAGEQRVELANDSEFTLAMKDLLRRYVNGEITDPEALHEERGRLLDQLSGAGNAELIGEGTVRIDNLVAIADQVKAMVGHGESLDQVLNGMKLYSAESRSNVRSEAHLDKIEQLVERLQKSKVGSFVSPETIGIAAAVSLGAVRAGRGTIIHALGVTVAPGVLGGAFAAVRESKRVKQERVIHAREMAQGKSYETGKRRDEMEGTRYDTIDASELTAQLEATLSSDNPTPSEVQVAYELIAGIEARIRLSDKRSIDLVSYSDTLEIERERRQLDEARAVAKRRLSTHMGELPDSYRTQFGITDGQSVNESLGRYTDAVVELDTDMDAKDKAYRKLRRRRIAKAAAVGAGTSLVLGLGTQELIAFVNPSYDGLAEHMLHGGAPSSDGRQTLLEGLVHGQSGGTSVEHIAPSSTYESYSLGAHQNALELPSDYKVVTGQGGTLSIEGPKGAQVVDNLTLQKDGALTPHSLELLKEHNVSVVDTGHAVTHEVSATKNLTVAEYNHAHAADTTHVTRDFWYDNNTAQYDKNELGLQWGNNGTGVGQHGDVQMNVSHMTQDGSYHGIEHTSWSQNASDGKLKLAVSASRDTQAQTYLIDVKSNGTVDIPKDSPAAKFFSIDKSGHAEFHGAYAEVVEVRGEVGGVTHIAPLATEVGSNSVTHVSDTVTTTTHEYVPHTKLTLPTIDKIVDTPARTVEGFGMPGFVPRRSLEQIRREVNYNGYGYGYNGGERTDLTDKWLRERSPRLKRNPDADLDTGQELKWYRDSQRELRGGEYVDTIDDYVGKSKVLREIGNETKAVVCIPVAAANEADNIYRTLSMFGRQDKESQKASLILLNINWKKSLESDPAQMAHIRKTLSEIKRVQKNFPDIRIASFEKVWSDEFIAEKNGRIYGEVIKILYDTAAFAMDRSVREGRRSSKTEAVLITNDADTEGMGHKYLYNYIKSSEENPKQDAFTGLIYRGVSSYKDYPGYGLVSNFYANASRAAIHRQGQGNGGFVTDGPNSGVRMSMYGAMGGAESEIGAGADGMLIYRMSSARRAEGERNLLGRLRRKDAPHGSDRVIGKLVTGASIDTLPDRLLGMYRQGRWVGSAWDNFDSEGYESRELVANAGTIGPEDPERDIDAITRRIELSIQEFGSKWWRDPAVLTRALRLTFGPNSPGNELYTHKRNSYINGDGAFVFHFTDKGKEELKKRMLFDRKGNPAPFGERMRHHLYDSLRSGKPSILLH
ncbi:MAG: hypothetical protein ABI397_00015 [Candidatus Saccharimonas sp.]